MFFWREEAYFFFFFATFFLGAFLAMFLVSFCGLVPGRIITGSAMRARVSVKLTPAAQGRNTNARGKNPRPAARRARIRR